MIPQIAASFFAANQRMGIKAVQPPHPDLPVIALQCRLF